MPDSISKSQMKALDGQFKFSNNGNNEILFTWLMLVTKSEYQPAYAKIESFLMTVGRRKFVAPLFESMASNEKLMPMAKRIYKGARENYHSVTFETVDGLLGMSDGAVDENQSASGSSATEDSVATH